MIFPQFSIDSFQDIFFPLNAAQLFFRKVSGKSEKRNEYKWSSDFLSSYFFSFPFLPFFFAIMFHPSL